MPLTDVKEVKNPIM